MYKKPLLTKRFLKNLSGNLEHIKKIYDKSGCTTINLYFEDESRFGLLTVLRRMITAKGVKPVAPFLHRFDNLYLFGAFSPFTGDSHVLEMPCCDAAGFQYFLDYLSCQHATEFKVLLLDNGAFHHAKKLAIPPNIALLFLPPYSPELNPAEKVWRYFKDRVSMIAYNNVAMLQNQISMILKNLTTEKVKSICGNRFYKKIFQCTFNV
jgi:transposase